MSSQYSDQKKRPPPIDIPPLPLPRPPHTFANTTQTNRNGQQQRDARNASNSTEQGPRSTGSTPLTSPLEQDGLRLPQSGSNRSRTSAKTTLSNLMDQTRASPRKSDHGSAVASQRGSTTRSRHSGRSYHSAAAAQAQLEALDEKTTRGQIESRSERNLFKMTGQVPPTPTTGPVNEDDVHIRTEDLRAQCRAASGEKLPDREESTKSPRKKLFGNIRNPFTKTSSPVPMPPMPSKAAQVFGTSARQPHKIDVRPIKPAHPIKTPTKVPRSDTSRSLPAKIVDPDGYGRRHHSGASRRIRAAGRRSPGRGSKQSSDAENTPPVPKTKSSFQSATPPTPPAKDTPPDHRPTASPASPLRRAAPSEDLRESYEAYVDNGMGLQFPEFNLSPSPSRTVIPEKGGASPTKFRPYTAEDYSKLIEGEPLQWPYPEADDSSGQQEGNRSAPLVSDNHRAALRLPRPDRQSEEHQYSNRDSRHLSPLPPRFYSPSNRSVCMFTEGETPSKNSDPNRLLFSIPSKANLLHLREDSNNGSIEMVFQGNPHDIDPNSSTGQLFSATDQDTPSLQVRDDTGLATRVKQELRISEQHGATPQKSGTSGHLQPDQSSSRLTDMLSSVSPRRTDFNSEFQPNCPSAVPSPLHNMPGSLASSQPNMADHGPFGPWVQTHTPKSVEDHFFMTNEHLDVVGKTTWDLLEMFKQQQLAALNTKHEQLVALIEKSFEDIRSQVNTVNEKADRTADKHNNIHNDLDKVLSFIKSDVAGALAAQDKKTTQVETHIKELQNTVQILQKVLEQKLTEPKTAQQHSATGPFSTPNTAHSPFPPPTHRSQPSLAGYYVNATESSRDAQPPLPHIHDRSMASPQEGHNDPRVGYNNGYGQQWGARSGYAGRNNKEDRTPYSGTNPYQFANGGQFNNSYAGYSPYGFSPSPPDQHYAFNQGPTK